MESRNFNPTSMGLPSNNREETTVVYKDFTHLYTPTVSGALAIDPSAVVIFVSALVSKVNKLVGQSIWFAPNSPYNAVNFEEHSGRAAVPDYAVLFALQTAMNVLDVKSVGTLVIATHVVRLHECATMGMPGLKAKAWKSERGWSGRVPLMMKMDALVQDFEAAGVEVCFWKLDKEENPEASEMIDNSYEYFRDNPSERRLVNRSIRRSLGWINDEGDEDGEDEIKEETDNEDNDD